jgi:hypothetical protein
MPDVWIDENAGMPGRIKNEEACANNRKLLRINGEKHDEMLLPLTPLSVYYLHNGVLIVRIHDGEKQK